MGFLTSYHEPSEPGEGMCNGDGLVGSQLQGKSNVLEGTRLAPAESDYPGLDLSLPSCVTLGKMLNLSVPWFAHLPNEDDYGDHHLPT